MMELMSVVMMGTDDGLDDRDNEGSDDGADERGIELK
jgi:hypothetical protein